jgi:hypothetical protein
VNPWAPARAFALAGVAMFLLAVWLPEDVEWRGPLLAGFVFVVLPAAVMVWVLGWMAGAAVPLTLLAWLALPRRWLRGVPAATVFCAAMLAAPVLFLSGLALHALATSENEWQEFVWRPMERPAPSPTMRHLFPTRSGAATE